MKSIRCGRGLGDSIYLQSVVRHLLGATLPAKPTLRVMSDYPDVFRPLGQAVHVQAFSRLGVSVVAHYVTRKSRPETTQFADCCIAANLPPGAVPLQLPWTLTDASLANDLRAQAAGRPIVCVQLPRAPMGRTDGFGAELLPDCHAIQTAIDTLRPHALIVQVGAGRPLYQFVGIEADYANRTSVAQLIDIATLSSAAIGYPSFLVPLAESLDLPALFVWSRRGLRSPRAFIAHITPGKLLHKRTTSRAIVDDAEPILIKRAAAALLEKPWQFLTTTPRAQPAAATA